MRITFRIVAPRLVLLPGLRVLFVCGEGHRRGGGKGVEFPMRKVSDDMTERLWPG